jgi:hypothetical protein
LIPDKTGYYIYLKHFAYNTSSETCLCLANQLIDDDSCKTNLLITQILTNTS